MINIFKKRNKVKKKKLLEKNKVANSKNLVKNPRNGGTPANEKKITTKLVFKKLLLLKNLYSFKVLNTLKSNKKNKVKKNTSRLA